jgi:hypothetical protein
MSISNLHQPCDAASPASIAQEFVLRWTVDQFHQMIEVGILTEGDPVELLDGWLVTKMIKNAPHRIATGRLHRKFDRILPPGWHLSLQDPITLATSEPEPDFAVVRGLPEDYPRSHPGPPNVAMVVEVADASLERDQGLKKRIYAHAAIPIYWIVNLIEHRIEVYSDPSGGAEPDYRQRQDYGSADAVPLVIEGQVIATLPVRDILP